MAMNTPSFWHQIDRLLARIRPHRQPLSLLIDGVVISLCWNFTYLFRLGFERWWEARPRYDPWVMLGVVAVYLAVFVAARIPRGMWRFSGFGEVKRLTLACGVAGLASGGRGPLADVSRRDGHAGATHLITAVPGAAAAQRRRAIELAAATGLPVLTVPSVSELRKGTARIERVRDIEPEDLLGRDPVKLDEAGIAEFITGKTVLVTRAGGS